MMGGREKVQGGFQVVKSTRDIWKLVSWNVDGWSSKGLKVIDWIKRGILI